MTQMMMRSRRLGDAVIGTALALLCVAGFSSLARAADYSAFGFVGTSADGGVPVTHETSGEEERLEDAYSASTPGSQGNRADAAYFGSVPAGIVGTLSHSHRPGLDRGEARAQASSLVKIFDQLTFTLPAGEYPEDVYAVLHGDYDGFLGAVGNYGTYATQTVIVRLGLERFFVNLGDYGDVANDGFYADEFTLATKLLNGGQVLTVPLETTRQVSAYLYSSTFAPAYLDASAESADSDFASTAQILSIDVPEGVTWTSASGVFLSAPEPGRLSLLLAGVGCLVLLERVRSGRQRSSAVAG